MASASRGSRSPQAFPAAHDDGAESLLYRRIVVKAGTAILTEAADGERAGGVNLAVLGSIVRQICQLREQGAEVMLVTSGAIAAGRAALALRQAQDERWGAASRDIRSRQVAAAVGQSRLMQIYQEQFALHGVTVAQALLTIGDLSPTGSRTSTWATPCAGCSTLGLFRC